jgi:hypothetical protein
MRLPPHQLLVLYPLRLVRLCTLPFVQIRLVLLVVAVGVFDLDRCWGLAASVFMGKTRCNAVAELLLYDVPCQRCVDTNASDSGNTPMIGAASLLERAP